MSVTAVTTHIKAPITQVFSTIAEVENFPKAIPHITHVNILSDIKSGIGTRFSETRLMNGREVTTILEVTEYVENERVRIVSDTNGCIWDSIFVLSETDDNQVNLSLVMEGRTYKLFAKFLNIFIQGMLQKALKSDIQAVKNYCETQSN